MMNLIDDKYEVLQKLQEKGMGKIYKVRHRLLDEIRVVKVMRPHASEDPDLRRRFFREARMATRVRHPNIGQLYDFSIDESGTAVIVMEFIDGVSLEEVLGSGPTPSLPFIVDIALQVLQALSCLHMNGIVHRDVASDNVMLTRSFDGRALAKLIDLGIAKDPTSDATATVSGAFVGKARYAAPEQFQGDRTAGPTPATDLYSFGVLLYEMLTGRLPFDGRSFAELAAGHLFQPPIPFRVTDPQGRIPSGLQEVVLLTLQKDPGRRIASAEALSERIRPFGATGASDPLEIDRLLDRARSAGSVSAGGAWDKPEPRPVHEKGPGGGAVAHDVARRAAREPSPVVGRIEAIVDALVSPFADAAALEILEVAHVYRDARGSVGGLPGPRVSGNAAPVSRPLPVAEESEWGVVVTPQPRGDRHRRQRPETAEGAWPRGRRGRSRLQPGQRWSRVAVIGVGLLLSGLAGYAVWLTFRDPLSGQIAMVRVLRTDTADAVSTKLDQVVALAALLPAGDDRRHELEQEKDRLTNLRELHLYHQRLERLLASASASDFDAGKAARDAEDLWILMREYRYKFSAGDRGAVKIEEAGRGALRRIAEITASERLRRLAQEP